MEYMPTFDQQMTSDLGISVNDAFLLHMVVKASEWARGHASITGDFFFLDYGKIMSELPVIFGSKQAVTRSVQALEKNGIIEIERAGRSNCFRVNPIISKYWSRATKDEEYREIIKQFIPKTEQSGSSKDNQTVPKVERSENGTIVKSKLTVPKTERYRSENGTITGSIVPKTEPIKQPLRSNNHNQTTKNIPTHQNGGSAASENLLLEGELLSAEKPPAKRKPASQKKTTTGEGGTVKGSEVWNSYASAYRQRYGVDPVRNATTNGQVVQLVKRLGYDAVPVAAWYVWHNDQFLVKNAHSFGLLLKNCEGYRTQWATGQQVTTGTARDAERKQNNLSAIEGALRMVEEEERRKAAAAQNERGATA